MTALKLEAKPQVQTIIINENESYDVVIIGGGPAGLTAAIYARRAKLNVLLIEKMMLGGTASSAHLIENYPGFPAGISGADLSKQIIEQAQNLALRVHFGNVIKIIPGKKLHEVRVDEKVFSTKTVILAVGTEAEKLNIPGEAELLGRGVSYCATCDGPFYQGKNIMVVGGGNSAVEEALFLTRFANKVSLVHRRDGLRADRILTDKARNHPKIYFILRSSLEKISGEKTVTAVSIRDLKLNRLSQVPIDGVFIYIGSRPNTGFLKEIIKLDEKGYIVTDEKMQTSLPGFFAAGDVRAKSLRQVVTAAADGAIAVNSVINSLSLVP